MKEFVLNSRDSTEVLDGSERTVHGTRDSLSCLAVLTSVLSQHKTE